MTLYNPAYLQGQAALAELLQGLEGAPIPITAAANPRRGAPIEDIRAAYKTALLKAHADDMVAMALEKGIELSLEEALRRIPTASPRSASTPSTATSTT